MKDGIRYCSTPEGGGSAEIKTITYEEYLANKELYDASGEVYAIPDYPYSNGKAKDIEFDDTVSNLSVDNTQDAIDAINSNLETLGTEYVLQTFQGQSTQVKNTNGTSIFYSLPYTSQEGYEIAQITAFGGSSYVSASINNFDNNYIYLNLSNSDTENWQNCTPYVKILFKKTS